MRYGILSDSIMLLWSGAPHEQLLQRREHFWSCKAGMTHVMSSSCTLRQGMWPCSITFCTNAIWYHGKQHGVLKGPKAHGYPYMTWQPKLVRSHKSLEKTQCFATFLPLRAPGSSFLPETFSFVIFFLFLFSSLTLPISAFHLSILSEVWLLNFLWIWYAKNFGENLHIQF